MTKKYLVLLAYWNGAAFVRTFEVAARTESEARQVAARGVPASGLRPIVHLLARTIKGKWVLYDVWIDDVIPDVASLRKER